jgi:hypothetical protein
MEWKEKWKSVRTVQYECSTTGQLLVPTRCPGSINERASTGSEPISSGCQESEWLLKYCQYLKNGAKWQYENEWDKKKIFRYEQHSFSQRFIHNLLPISNWLVVAEQYVLRITKSGVL